MLHYRSVEVDGLVLQLRRERAAADTALHAEITAQQQPECARLAVGVSRQEQALRLQADIAEEASAAGFEIGRRIIGEEGRGPVLFRPDWCLSEAGEPDVGFAFGYDAKAQQPREAGLRFPGVRRFKRHAHGHLPGPQIGL